MASIMMKENHMNEIIIKHGQIHHQINNISITNHVITVAKNKQHKNPILIHIKDQSIADLTLEVETSVEAEIIINYDHNIILEMPYHLSLKIKNNAQVKLIIISKLLELSSNLVIDAEINRDATLKLIGGFINQKSIVDLNLNLKQEGANVFIHTVSLVSFKQEQKLNVNIVHQAPYTFGDMTNIGIASMQGKIVLNGVEKILKGMKHASAFQTLKGVILSHQAIVEVNPVLLIDEYDVKAGHGATVGKIDEDILYYLRSRGLTQAEAEKLFIHGYIKPVIDEIEDEVLKESVMLEMNHRI
jgi:Fe-S cluster assembly protein SufD